MSVYLVTGTRRYREHKPGELFEASLDKETERRAIDVGAIRIVNTNPTGLVPSSYKLPRGWPPEGANE